MKLSEVIALAKAGYRKADIDELLAIQADEPEPEPVVKSTGEDNGAVGAAVASPEEKSGEGPDYEQLYKDVLGQIDTLKNDLKAAQERNQKANQAGEPVDPMADLADVFRSYM